MDSGAFPVSEVHPVAPRAQEWRWLHASMPALAFVGAFMVLQLWGDRVVSVFYDANAARWLLDPDLPLSRLLYRGERALIGALALAGLGVLLGSVWLERLRPWRRPVSYLLVCLVTTTSLVSAGKHLTNVDCPRALIEYGGHFPQVGLLQDRPAAWPRAQCFPAGHSSAAFAFVSLYFLFGAVRPQWRWRGLAAGLALGLAFGATQWARGMHFPSHDLTSAAIAWVVALGAYTALYRRRLWDAYAPAPD